MPAVAVVFLALLPAGQPGVASAQAAGPAVVGAWAGQDQNSGLRAKLELTAEGRYVWSQQADDGTARTFKGSYTLTEGAILLKADGAAQAGVLKYRLADEQTLELSLPARVLRLGRQDGSLTPAKPPAAEPAQAGEVRSPGGYVLHRCLDEKGFKDETGKPLEVFQVLAPRGWKLKGGLTWVVGQKDPRLLDEGDLSRPAVLAFSIQSPDDRVALEVYPGMGLVDISSSPAGQMGLFPPGSKYMGMISSPVLTPADYILKVVLPQQRGLRGGVKVLEKKDLPELAKLFAAEDRLYAQGFQAIGGSCPTTNATRWTSRATSSAGMASRKATPTGWT